MNVVAPAGDDSTLPTAHFVGCRDGYSIRKQQPPSLPLVLFVLFARPRLIWSVICPCFIPILDC